MCPQPDSGTAAVEVESSFEGAGASGFVVAGAVGVSRAFLISAGFVEGKLVEELLVADSDVHPAATQVRSKAITV